MPVHWQLIPAGVLLLTIIYDLSARLAFPKSVRSIYRTIALPFRGFLHLEDLEGPIGPNALPNLSASRWMGFVSLMQACVWLSGFIYALVSGDLFNASEAALGSVAWVRFVGWLRETH
jgi:hypothetical protein